MSTITRRRTRTDAKLERLNEAQRERLHFWFEENRTYAEIVRLLRDEFGLSVGKSTVGAYWRRHMLPEQERDETEIVAGFAARSAADFDAATLNRVKVLAWLAVARPDPDVDLAVKLLAIVGRVERHALAIERLALEKRKVALREKRRAQREAAAELQSAAVSDASPAVSAVSSGELSDEMSNLPRFPGKYRTEFREFQTFFLERSQRETGVFRFRYPVSFHLQNHETGIAKRVSRDGRYSPPTEKDGTLLSTRGLSLLRESRQRIGKIAGG